MNAYILAPAAQRDVEQIADFIAEDSVDAALRFLDKVETTFGKLAEAPEMGSRREEFAPGKDLRFWPLYTYLIVYRPSATPLEIARVVSGFRDLTSVLGGT